MGPHGHNDNFGPGCRDNFAPGCRDNFEPGCRDNFGPDFRNSFGFSMEMPPFAGPSFGMHSNIESPPSVFPIPKQSKPPYPGQ